MNRLKIIMARCKELLGKIASVRNKSAEDKERDAVEKAEKTYLRKLANTSKYTQERTDNRFFKMLLTLSLSVLVVFALNNRELADKLTVNIPQPLLEVFIDSERQEYTYRTVEEATDSTLRMTKRYVTEYIQDRETFHPDKALMDKKWGGYSRLYWRTDKKHWRKANRILKRKKKVMLKRKMTRSVQPSKPEDMGDGWWHVKATFIDEPKRGTPKEKTVSIFLHGKYIDLKMPSKYENQNEIGWVVDKYSVTLQKGEMEKDGEI
ncbi:hypothetical protein MTBPR1_80191 [Candidatus Terasakiella magnetica]|uniref:Bacterial virulence protein VirB8 domain-containing protein n=1 Tax=Candidatus Terasakiella magnetica TaxID=1867952 RepID=A0A1C3RLK0_9PROT|nr:hypothetical protein [Candidatus Terasakiella magnetica]SCA58137.1 hypothetical protein MTBPR1_80191 [Candidatus Terasakiella magnetica]